MNSNSIGKMRPIKANFITRVDTMNEQLDSARIKSSMIFGRYIEGLNRKEAKELLIDAESILITEKNHLTPEDGQKIYKCMQRLDNLYFHKIRSLGTEPNHQKAQIVIKKVVNLLDRQALPMPSSSEANSKETYVTLSKWNEKLMNSKVTRRWFLGGYTIEKNETKEIISTKEMKKLKERCAAVINDPFCSCEQKKIAVEIIDKLTSKKIKKQQVGTNPKTLLMFVRNELKGLNLLENLNDQEFRLKRFKGYNQANEDEQKNMVITAKDLIKNTITNSQYPKEQTEAFSIRFSAKDITDADIVQIATDIRQWMRDRCLKEIEENKNNCINLLNNSTDFENRKIEILKELNIYQETLRAGHPIILELNEAEKQSLEDSITTKDVDQQFSSVTIGEETFDISNRFPRDAQREPIMNQIQGKSNLTEVEALESKDKVLNELAEKLGDAKKTYIKPITSTVNQDVASIATELLATYLYNGTKLIVRGGEDGGCKRQYLIDIKKSFLESEVKKVVITGVMEIPKGSVQTENLTPFSDYSIRITMESTLDNSGNMGNTFIIFQRIDAVTNYNAAPRPLIQESLV